MSSSEGFDGTHFRDVSPRIAKTSHHVFGTRRRRRFRSASSSISNYAHSLAAVVTSLGQDWTRPRGTRRLSGPGRNSRPPSATDRTWQQRSSQIVVQAPGGFEWATEPDPTGAALAEYFPSATSGQGNLYINPQVKSDQAPRRCIAAAGRFDGQPDPACQRHDVDRHDRLSGSDRRRNGHGHCRAISFPRPIRCRRCRRPANVVGTFQVTDRRAGRYWAELRTRFRPSGRDRAQRRRL